ncbi:19290_t:CDS:2 [Funneliformis geosporum]|uniref:Gamma-soluble NSF attachment protein n=1 Tax=Funneliformis geosporum TaxID=1117311 RepID=A0A9W4SXE1_9GLOM|nr:13525_t:CDS:2 [Funneliformis geosporum]CAI2184957.1 19290_t:CDS:2 [Funneliformis geosporum]
MNENKDIKIREAVQFLTEGDKATKKSWFKKPEWDVAGQNYDKAASCFKAARSFDQAIQAYQKASDAMFKSDSLFMAAKSMESAANLAAQQLKQPERASEMYRKASDLYQAHMTPDRAGEITMEPISVDSAIEFYVAACNLFESEDRGRFAIDTFKRTIATMIKNKRYIEAVEIMHRLSKIYQSINNQSGLNKNCLGIIITLLAAEDEVEAKKQFQTFCQHAFVRSEESAISSSLLDAFEQGDQDLIDKVMRNPIVTYLDNEVAKLSRELQVPGFSSRPYIPQSVGPEKKNMYNQPQSDSYSLQNQEKKTNPYYLNDNMVNEDKSLHDHKDEKQTFDGDNDENVIVPPKEDPIHQPPSAISAPVHSQETAEEEDDGLC